MHPVLKTRRAWLAGLAASALALASPRSFAAPPRGLRTVGYLTGGTDGRDLLALLAELGYVEGRDVRLEVRRAPTGSDAAQIQAAATELASAKVDVLFAFGAERVLALRAATKTIPIVAAGVPNPVGLGLADSLQRSGRNVTGLAFERPEVPDYQVRLLRQLVPGLKRLVAISQVSAAELMTRAQAESCRVLGIAWELHVVKAEADLPRVLETLRHPQAEAVFLIGVSEEASTKVAAAALRQRIAVMSLDPADVQRRALISVGCRYVDPKRRAVAVLDKVLRGTSPAEIPFEQPDRTDIVVNRGTARAIGVELPADLLIRATSVVE